MFTLTPFEETLVQPFSAPVAMENIRLRLLQGALTPADTTRAARYVHLQAFRSELALILRDLTPPPTSAMLATPFADRSPVITLAADLRRNSDLRLGVDELYALGAPGEYREMLVPYTDAKNPREWVDCMCAILCLAKLLEASP